jgi:H+-transporting ATPase
MEDNNKASPEEKEQETSLEKGLDQEEVLKWLREYGYNEVAEKKENRAAAFVKKFWGVTPWMLEVTIALELLLGKRFEAYVVGGLLLFNAILGFVQEGRANAALDLLKQKLRISARVKRGGQWTLVPARELVPGDMVRLRAGDFVPADIRLAEGSVEVDQSALTGESQMVRREANDLLYGGSALRRGEATGVVSATGAKTYFGRTVELVQVAKPKLHMEEVTSRVVRWLIMIVSSFLALALVLTILRGISLLEVLPLAVVLLVSAIPVALPTMFTISMALGSLELVKKGVLVTRLSAIEDAATMNIVCADKTGTMTFNRLSVMEAFPLGAGAESDVILYGALASQEADQDPLDLAFIAAARESHLSLDIYRQKNFVPFDASTRRTEALVEKDETRFVAVKGAVNTLTALCKPAEETLSRIRKRMEDPSAGGYRAIAVARGPSIESLEMVGIAFLYDRPRPDAPELIRELKDLGVTLKMLTGDALPVAREVARQLGLGENVTKISDLKTASDSDVLKLVEESSGFAEIYPEDKYLIVQHLQKGGLIVGMTGDGVNDAPALRQSEVGIAVSSATDVAKKAAGAVLTVEGLIGIVDLVKIGRMTYQRIITWVLNKIIKTFQIAVFVVLFFLATGRYVMSPLHMILLLFLTDFVTLSISTDNVRYSSKPDSWDIFGLVKVALLLGVLVIAELTLLLYTGSRFFRLDGSIGQLQTFTFELLIFVELLDVLIIRERKRFWSSKPSRSLLLIIMADLALVFLISVFGIPGISPIPVTTALSIPLLSALVVFGLNDPIKAMLVKRFWPRI